MEFIKRSWRQIRTQAEHLPPNARWLIGVCTLCLGLVVVLVSMYIGRSDYISITQFAGDRQAEAISQLSAVGIKVNTDNGLSVRRDQYIAALARLHHTNLMTADTSVAFEQLFKSSNIWMSSHQFDQRFRVVRQQWLGQVIAGTKGVRSATVVFAVPNKIGFGAVGRRPSAAVHVVMTGRKRLDRHIVEAIAGLVSGAVVDMQPSDVRVIDANWGELHTVRSDAEVSPDDRLQAIQQREMHTRDKIVNELLGYIHGVIVAVNVQMDTVGASTVTQWVRADTDVLSESKKTSRSRINQNNAGAPGAQSNTGETIVGANAFGTLEKENTKLEKFAPRPITEETSKRLVGQTVKQINVSVSVPRSYLEAVLSRGKGAADGESDLEDQLDLTNPRVQAEMTRIKTKIMPLVRNVEGVAGEVNVDWHDDRPMIAQVDMLLGSQNYGALAESPWVKQGGLILLALTAVGIMLYLRRTALQHPSLPTAKELAGLPPTLTGGDDLIGEVEQSELAMTGVEVAEEDIRSRKVAEQISDLVKANPQEAADLFNRWVATKE